MAQMLWNFRQTELKYQWEGGREGGREGGEVSYLGLFLLQGILHLSQRGLQFTDPGLMHLIKSQLD